MIVNDSSGLVAANHKKTIREETVGKYYKSLRPKKVFIPCVKYKLPSEDPLVDGVGEIIYAESLHYHEGPYSCELNLECPSDTKAFYTVEMANSVFKETSNTVTVSSKNLNDEEYSFVHQGCLFLLLLCAVKKLNLNQFKHAERHRMHKISGTFEIAPKFQSLTP